MRLMIRGCVAVFLLMVLTGAAMPAAASPAAQDPTCLVTGDKVASPARIVLGDEVQIRLTLQPDCPPATFRAADIVMAIDRSRSMLDGGKMTAAKSAARAFVDATDLTLHQVSVVAFHFEASVEIQLSQDKTALFDAIDAIGIESGTNIAEAIDVSLAEIQRGGRPDTLPVIILITDGAPNRPAPDPETAAIVSANFAKLAGVQILTVGLGSDAAEDLLKQLASSDADYYYSPSTAELEDVYRSIAIVVGDVALRDLTLDDTLSSSVQLVAGSGTPDPQVSGQVLTWTAGLVPSTGLTWIYKIKPDRSGTYPANDQAVATYTDVDGTERQFVFPQPMITVEDPAKDVPCNKPGGWTIMVHSFPDSVGVSGSSYPGCNNRFDSGDWLDGTRYRLPDLEFEVTDPEGTQVYYQGKGVPGAGRVDQRLYIRICQPPPYRLRLVTTDLNGYELCPNSPAERLITERKFRPRVFQRTEVRFGFVR